jgi:serine/threonine protein kinase
LRDNKFNDENRDLLRSWIRQLINGLKFIHGQDVIHRYLKPRFAARVFKCLFYYLFFQSYYINHSPFIFWNSNIILTGTSEAINLKYTDFYHARADLDSKQKATKILNLSVYSAPELMRSDANDPLDQNKSVDIWYLHYLLNFARK